MRAYILKGGRDLKSDYIDKFVGDQNIPLFNVFRFEGQLKISQAREIKRNLSITSAGGHKRLYIIEDEPTIEAQNALLKTLEELPEDTTFIFLNHNNLLSTVVSRAVIVNLENAPSEEAKLETDLAFRIASAKSLKDVLLAAEEYFSDDQKSLDNLITTLREVLFDSVHARHDSRTLHVTRILKKLVSYRGLVDQNNLNPRITLERILLTS